MNQESSVSALSARFATGVARDLGSTGFRSGLVGKIEMSDDFNIYADQFSFEEEEPQVVCEFIVFATQLTH
jgi:hypothetical protein